MAQFGHISTRGRAALLILATGGTVLGAGVARSLAPAAAAGTTVQLTTSTPTVVVGHAANLTARVITATTGSVTFLIDGAPVPTTLGGTKTLSGGKNSVNANFTMNSLGAHQVTARYNAGTMPVSAPVTINVVNAGTGVAAVSIVSSLGTTIQGAGTPLTLTASVSGTPVPTGTISFTDSLTPLPSSSNRVLTNGAVSINLAGLPLGQNVITASYSGNPTYAPATGTLTITVTPTPSDKFLQHLYTDMLNQQDPAGEAWWASQMAKGINRYNVTYPFTQTQAYDNAVVAQLYANIMQRPPDATGFNFWAAQMHGGKTPEEIAATMVASDERFVNPSFGNNDVDTFIAATYQALLGRSDAGDPGAAFWHDFLYTGHPRWQMTLDFVNSPEWAAVTVRNMYAKFHLGTSDTAGMNYWAGQVLGGLHDDQLAAELTASQQYYDWTQAN